MKIDPQIKHEVRDNHKNKTNIFSNENDWA